jgi:hypothetical protein
MPVLLSGLFGNVDKAADIFRERADLAELKEFPHCSEQACR